MGELFNGTLRADRGESLWLSHRWSTVFFIPLFPPWTSLH